MYYNHNLRTSLQEWKNRLYRTNYDQFGHQFKYALNNIESNTLLASLMQEAIGRYPYPEETLKQFQEEEMQYGSVDICFENPDQHAAYCYRLIQYLLIQAENNYNFHTFTIFHRGEFSDTQQYIIENLVSPIFYFFHDKLEKSSSVLFLLEKYKKRTEWFTAAALLEKYTTVEKGYEQIFEDDLRLFLFDQGIDYPFSTPKSNSGRADIIGAIDTTDPIVIEIKIFNREKGYGKNRIKEGFTQIVKYTNDYNKDVGYLIILNIDKAEISFSFSQQTKVFPPMLSFNNKTYYFITIDLYQHESASKIGNLETITVSESDLIGSK